MKRIGTNAYHWQNFCTTTVIKHLQMAPFGALYDRCCRTPLSWSQTGERKIFGPDLVTKAEEKVKTIQNNLKATQS
jgi:hypothetical protein